MVNNPLSVPPDLLTFDQMRIMSFTCHEPAGINACMTMVSDAATPEIGVPTRPIFAVPFRGIQRVPLLRTKTPLEPTLLASAIACGLDAAEGSDANATPAVFTNPPSVIVLPAAFATPVPPLAG